ncbi:nucleoside diphosphate kinase [Thermosyntropha lipolytica DSM 11003]|uniref:Nucleoside diphosphate kinase n=1 Tax=Thermosyntropha lipolytica DSM 11003 TaxID=1123382 RepID=A0A1M5JTW5_9FIRM|nr:nucleoside-diphosphate kinase [Thermosyntropha lipolytica]SHG43996.1 nucleoside diphosphate kinase [Thermosyntropha lipolytica DSM 11003]
MERTFIMVKPDGVQRGLIGELISRIEKKGFKIAALKMLKIDEELAKKHYAEHIEKPFFPELLAFITSGPVVAMVVEGDGVIAGMRKLMGKTNPKEAEIGTIRGDFGITTSQNLIHGSDSPEAAKREISLFFKEEEIIDYTRDLDKWIF